MTLLWLFVWAFSGFPKFSSENGESWAIALCVMAAIDIGTTLRSVAKSKGWL